MPKFRIRSIGIAAIILCIAIFDLGGLLGPFDRGLMDLRFRLLNRPASGQAIVVQIDSRSLRELEVWPWPRTYHAEVIERLLAAGVREIAWDIDFSARSDEDADRAFADALRQAEGRVILPAFRQTESPEAIGRALYDTLPHPLFRDNAQIGSVNVSPEPDGLVRRVSDVQVVGDARLPSLFALLVGPSGVQGDRFFVDFGIDPNSIPRVSYVDVLRGEVPAGRLAGRSVIVGATAAELGDILPVPVYRSMPGAVLQAMAYESLVQGRAIHSLGPAISVPGSAVLVLLLCWYGRSRSWRHMLAAAILTVAALEATAAGVQAAAPIAVMTAPWLLAVLLSVLFVIAGRIETQAREILSQRIAIATRRALMDRMIENSFDGIIIADQDQTIQVMNRAAEGILDYAAAQAVGKSIDLILLGASNLTTGLRPVWDGDDPATSHAPREFTLVLRERRRIDIELIVGMVRLAPMGRRRGDAGPDRTFHTFTFRDISERKRVQEAERRAIEEAVAANRAKTEFLANMSHELRTPLNAIIGFSEAMQSEVFGPIQPPRYRDYIGDIGSSGRHLLDIINDILDVARVELGKYKIDREPIDPHTILDTCTKIAAGWPAYAERRFESDIADKLPTILADARVIKQAIINLLSNAFKYSREDDQVILSAAADGDGWLVVTVRDTGIGIPRDHLPKLTKAFYQVDGAFTRGTEGAGLGLFLTASFIRMHDGELRIESEPGLGTTVTIRLPNMQTKVKGDQPAAAIAATA